MAMLTPAEFDRMLDENRRGRARRDDIDLRSRGIIAGPAEPSSEADELDEDSHALLTALAELSDQRRSFDPAKHARNPKGSPGGGRFRSMVDRIKDAIDAHAKSGAGGDPFKDFNREQLRRVAKARGIELKRGEGRDEIAKRLLDDLGGHKAPPAPLDEKAAVVPPGKARAAGRDISSDVDFKSLPAAYNPKTSENDALKAIIRRQGFDGKPRVVSGAEFDDAVRRGEARETWRGLSTPVGKANGEDLAEQFRTGDFYVGLGINGDGTYVALSKADGQYYGSTLLRIGLHRDANVISADDLDVEMDAFFAKQARKSAQLRALDQKLLRDLAAAKTARARANIRRRYRNDVDGLDPDRSTSLQRDPGIFAALRGYDAIEIPKERSPDHHHEMIILNRTATIVQEA